MSRQKLGSNFDMKQTIVNKFIEWRDCVQFLTSCFAVYGVLDNRLALVDSDDFIVFYDRSFLRKRQWKIIPLWEGDLRRLLLEQGEINLSKSIRAYSLERGIKTLYRATVERAKAPYESIEIATDVAVKIATHKIDLELEDIAELFEVTDKWVPYWGHNFIWPEDGSFLLYTNGDNAAFMAGNLLEIEKMLGVGYDYCMSRFVANVLHPNWDRLIEPYKNFCDEFQLPMYLDVK
ncbi:MAG: hypothetical protein LBV44_01135 [Methylobacillus sp.]|nr:hypothetical protein [Methylobacillus sp.]